MEADAPSFLDACLGSHCYSWLCNKFWTWCHSDFQLSQETQQLIAHFAVQATLDNKDHACFPVLRAADLCVHVRDQERFGGLKPH